MPHAKSATEILEALEQADETRQRALAEARRVRASQRTLREMREHAMALQSAVDVLEEHLEVRAALREAISKPPIVKATKKRSKDAIEVPIAPNSDEHFDATFTLVQTGGWNEQNPEIAEEKVHTYVRKLIRLYEIQAMDATIPHLVLPFMGDMIEGELHAKSERTTSMTPLEASRFAYRMKRTIIDSLLATDIPRILIPCVDGNHGRTTAKRTPGLNQRYSYEHDVYLRLADHYLEAGEGRVEFYVPETDFVRLEIWPGYWICITHGDAVKYGGGVGGLTIPLLKAVDKHWRKSNPADLYICGHFHVMLDHGNVLVNPTAMGTAGYGGSNGWDPGEFPKGAQLFTVVHTGMRKRSTTRPIWVR